MARHGHNNSWWWTLAYEIPSYSIAIALAFVGGVALMITFAWSGFLAAFFGICHAWTQYAVYKTGNKKGLKILKQGPLEYLKRRVQYYTAMRQITDDDWASLGLAEASASERKKQLRKLIDQYNSQGESALVAPAKDVLDRFGLNEVQNDSTYKFKVGLTVFTLGCAVINMVVFASVIGFHTLTAAKDLLIYFYGPVYPAAWSALLPILITPLAVIAGYGMFVFATWLMEEAIAKNALKKLFVDNFWNKFKFNKPIKGNEKAFVGHVIKSILVALTFIGVIAASILVILSGSGAMQNAMLEVFSAMFGTPPNWFAPATTAMIFITVIPSNIYYSIKYLWKSINAFARIGKDAFFGLAKFFKQPKQTIQDVRDWFIVRKYGTADRSADPYFYWRVPGMIVGFVFAIGALVIHAFCEGALSGEVSNDVGQLFGDVFVKVSNAIEHILGISVSTSTFAASLVFVTEGASDLPFVISTSPGGHDHGGDKLVKAVGEATAGFGSIFHEAPGAKGTPLRPSTRVYEALDRAAPIAAGAA